MKQAPLIILEGSWWNHHEVPLVFPYFHALATSQKNIKLSHRTIRTVEDIGHYCSKIPKGAGAMLYFACHGKQRALVPAGRQSAIPEEEWLNALRRAKPGAISFIHFGCCEMVNEKDRHKTHLKVLEASGAKWASGYTKSVDWLQSMFLDLALVSEVFVPDHNISDGRTTPLKRQADKFVKTYNQLARELGFSALTHVSGGALLFPQRLHRRA